MPQAGDGLQGRSWHLLLSDLQLVLPLPALLM